MDRDYVKKGDAVIRVPQTFCAFNREVKKEEVRPIKGIVTFVHPRGRFHTVSFPMPGGVIRECFQGVRIDA